MQINYQFFIRNVIKEKVNENIYASCIVVAASAAVAAQPARRNKLGHKWTNAMCAGGREQKSRKHGSRA